MKPIPFTEDVTLIAEDQDEYNTLPCHRSNDSYGTITVCWKLTWKERIKLLLTGILWHQILTFNCRLQPQMLLVDKPDEGESEHTEST